MGDDATSVSAQAGTDRPALSRSIVLDAALALLDGGDEVSLSRRRLATHLGVSTMATYHYVPDESYLREGLAELLADELDGTGTAPTWQDSVRDLAWSFRAMVNRHPAAFRFVLTEGWPDAFVTVVARASSDIAAAGYDADTAERMARAVARVLLGSALIEQGGFGAPTPPEDAQVADTNFRFTLEALLAGMTADG